MQALKMQWR